MGEEKGHKRKAEGSSGGGKNKKPYFNSGSHGKSKGIPPGTRGVMVSTIAGKETQAAREAIALLTEAYEALRPKTAAVAAAPADAGTDIAAALASEVAELKDASKQLFLQHSSGLNSVVYVQYRDAEGPNPVELVTHICRQIKETRQSRSRFCCRFHPVEYQCFASLDKIEELAEKVVAERFPSGDDVTPVSFAVQYEHRAAPQLDRMAVIDAFAKRVPQPHKVNLNSADQTILVNLMKSVCAVAVVPQFKELMKLNVRSLTGENDEQKAKSKAGQDKARQQQPEQQQEGQELQPEQQLEQQQGQDQQGVEAGTASTDARVDAEGDGGTLAEAEDGAAS